VGAQVGNGLRVGVRRDGTVMTQIEDQEPIPLTNVVAIAARESDGLVLKADGTVVGWKSDALRLTNTQMYAVSGISNVVAIAIGGGHGGGISIVSLGLLKDGTVVTWGAKMLRNDFAPPAGLSNVVAIAAGLAHCLALKSNGTVMAWGDNEEGQVTGVPSNRQSPDAQGLVRINGQILTNVVAISASNEYSLALKRDGTVVGWGKNCPGIPAGLSHVVAISAGDDFCLAITTNNATADISEH
jgi:alpha-tubulin suppressor-like RCC1 family protein